MDEQKKKLLKIGGIILLAILVVVVSVLYVNKKNEVGQEPAEEPVLSEEQRRALDAAIEPEDIPDPELIAPLPPENPDDRYLKQLARDFVERYGSYSNQNDNQHLEDVAIFATDRMNKWLATQRKNNEAEYSGQTTVVITSAIAEKTDDTATIAIEARQEQQTATNTVGENKKATVLLAKSGNTWKVDGVFWE